MKDGYAGLPVIDVTVADWWREPAEVTASMHERGEVAAFVPSFSTVSFLRYDDCLAALTDPNGVHFCSGASLARLEAEVAFTTLLSRYRCFEEVGSSDWTSCTPLRGRQRLDLALGG